jgi:hypothetical protein
VREGPGSGAIDSVFEDVEDGFDVSSKTASSSDMASLTQG